MKRAWYGQHLYIAEACFKYNMRRVSNAFERSMAIAVGA